MQVKHSYDKFKNKTISKGESKNFPVSKAWERDSISKRDIFRLKTWNFFFFCIFTVSFFMQFHQNYAVKLLSQKQLHQNDVEIGYNSSPSFSVVLSVLSLTPCTNNIRKYKMENSRSKQFISFTYCSILSSMMSSHNIPLVLPQTLNYSFVQNLLPISHSAPSCLSGGLPVQASQCLCSSNPYFT